MKPKYNQGNIGCIDKIALIFIVFVATTIIISTIHGYLERFM